MARTKVLLLLDEAALWRVAGLTQLERSAFSLAEFAIRQDHEVQLFLFWHPDLPARKRWQPDDARYQALDPIITDPPPPDVYVVLSSRHLVTAEAVGWALDNAIQRIDSPASSWNEIHQRLPVWSGPVLNSADDIEACTKALFAGSGKPQDGPVSRHFNRPISQWLSRRLVDTPITPNQWTLGLTVLPVLGSLLIARGSYGSFIAGALLYQLYSILDGCDGEIARARFLATRLGKRLDTACDFAANLLLLVALGIGCARASAQLPLTSSLYFHEGLVAAMLIALYEGALYLGSRITAGHRPAESTTLYSRQQHLIAYSGILKLGHAATNWLVQLTKRDVVVLLFLFLAVCGLPQLMLHAYLVFGLIATPLAAKAAFRAWRGARFRQRAPSR